MRYIGSIAALSPQRIRVRYSLRWSATISTIVTARYAISRNVLDVPGEKSGAVSLLAIATEKPGSGYARTDDAQS